MHGYRMVVTSAAEASQAGHNNLSILCWLNYNNPIAIEGNTNLSFSEVVGARYKGYG